MTRLPPDLVEQLALARLRRLRLDPEEMRALAMILAGVMTVAITLLCVGLTWMRIREFLPCSGCIMLN